MKLKFWKSKEQRRLWREICYAREQKRQHYNCYRSFQEREEALIKQYEALNR